MEYDFNELERRAEHLIASRRPQDAIKIYLHMADGDPSLDGGYLAKRIAQCYEGMGDLHSAKYWYGRAVEENPEVRRDCKEARERLQSLTNEDLVSAAS